MTTTAVTERPRVLLLFGGRSSEHPVRDRKSVV